MSDTPSVPTIADRLRELIKAHEEGRLVSLVSCALVRPPAEPGEVVAPAAYVDMRIEDELTDERGLTAVINATAMGLNSGMQAMHRAAAPRIQDDREERKPKIVM